MIYPSSIAGKIFPISAGSKNALWRLFLIANYGLSGAIIVRSQFPDYWPGEVERRRMVYEQQERDREAKAGLEVAQQAEAART